MNHLLKHEIHSADIQIYIVTCWNLYCEVLLNCASNFEHTTAAQQT